MSNPTFTGNTINNSTATETIKPVDYQALYESQREETERLATIVASARLSGTPASKADDDRVPAVSAERAKALLGPIALLGMSRDAKIAALGIDPKSVSDDLLRRTFGRGADPSMGTNLMNTSKFRYRQLKECAKMIDAFGG